MVLTKMHGLERQQSSIDVQPLNKALARHSRGHTILFLQSVESLSDIPFKSDMAYVHFFCTLVKDR